MDVSPFKNGSKNGNEICFLNKIEVGTHKNLQKYAFCSENKRLTSKNERANRALFLSYCITVSPICQGVSQNYFIFYVPFKENFSDVENEIMFKKGTKLPKKEKKDAPKSILPSCK